MPHVTITYSHLEADAAPYAAALAAVVTPPVSVSITAVALIRQERQLASLPPPLSYRRWTIASPAQLGILRAQLRYLVRGWGFAEDCTDRILMIVNELAANAVDHARTTCAITIRRTSSIVRVLVADDSPLPPRVLPHDVDAARGRGLQMVKALANRWGWTARHHGKTVWAAVNCSQP